MEKIKAFLAAEKNLWIALGSLWLVSVIVGIIDFGYDTKIPVNASMGGYTRPPEHQFWDMMFNLFLLVYAAGGFVLGKLHSRLVKNYPAAEIIQTKAPGTVKFEITPAKRYYAFWFTGLMGIPLIWGFSSFLSGESNAMGIFLIGGFGGVLALLGWQPKLWKAALPHSFNVNAKTLSVDGQEVALDTVRGFAVVNSLAKPSERTAAEMNTYNYQPAQQTYVTGSPMAAHTFAATHAAMVGSSAAAGAGIAAVANAYYREMKAKSWEVQIRAGSTNYTLARGLDEASVNDLMEDLQKAIAELRPAATISAA